MSNVVSLGPKKKAFKSIRLAAEAAGLPYMTYYMRLRMGVKPAQAASKPVRMYRRKMPAWQGWQGQETAHG